MKTLWNFGDSFSQPFKNNIDGPDSYKNLYIEYKGYAPPITSEILAEKLGYECITPAPNSFDNESILEAIIDNLDNFQEGDFIMVGWAPIGRVRIAEDNDWNIINIHWENDYEDDYSCLNKFALKFWHPLRVKYLEKISKLLKVTLPKNNFLFWHWSLVPEHIIIETIHDETNGLINDHHWNEKGHKSYADYLFKYYKTNGSFPNFYEDRWIKNWVT